MVKFKIKVDDYVKVISGNHKGKVGLVLKLFKKRNLVLVNDVNVLTKHIKPSAENPSGTISTVAHPIHISNVVLVDENRNPAKIGFKFVDGKKLRINKITGEEI